MKGEIMLSIFIVALLVVLGLAHIEHRLEDYKPKVMHNTSSLTVPGLTCTAWETRDHYISRIECVRDTP